MAMELADEVRALSKSVAVMETTIILHQEALVHQATEYERRLAELNHAHQQQIQRNADYVNRELWEAGQRSSFERLEAIQSGTNTRINQIHDKLNDFENWRSRLVGILIGVGLGAGVAGGGIGALIVKLLGS